MSERSGREGEAEQLLPVPPEEAFLTLFPPPPAQSQACTQPWTETGFPQLQDIRWRRRREG